LFAVTGWLGAWLARLTVVALGLLVLLVSADVMARTLGWRPISWATSAAEYVLLYTAFLPMPALVRGKGHVFVEFIRAPLPPRIRRACEVLVYLVCVAICTYLAWVAASLCIDAARTGRYETRTFDMPMWAVYLPIAIGFALSCIEWLRFLIGRDSLYDVDPLKAEGY
jgi:TRAP-type C4-dicarboxylate transport system permease small subunit